MNGKLLLIFLVLFNTGCNVQTGIAPIDTIIPKSSDRDFGFSGTWLPAPNPNFPHKDDGILQLQIARELDYTAIVSDASGRNEGEFTVNFRTHEISPEHPHAIVEIELRNNDEILYHRLAIAAVKDDQLFLWMIDGRKIGEPLFNDGVTAVIEHFTFSTSVRCDPKKLLDSISKHAKDILGDLQTFRRKKTEQGK
jgi:hypothetical protein